MKRRLALGLGAAALLAVASCSQNGSYRLSWNFQVDGVTVSSAVGCGRYYVDSILVTGADETGDVQQLRAICTPGAVTSTVPDGTWSFQIQMLNAQGALIQSMTPTQTTSPEPIASGAPQTQFPVINLVPLLASSNRDGGVDLADSGHDGSNGDGGVDLADSGHDGSNGDGGLHE